MSATDTLRAAVRAVASISTAPSTAEAAKTALAFASELGVHSLSVVERPNEAAAADGAILYTNAPEAQVVKYRDRGYVRVDPIVQRTLRGDEARLLSSIGEERLTNLERKVFTSFHCGAGIKDGLVIPVRRSVHPDGVITFGGAEPDLSATAKAALTVLGHCVYGRLDDLRAAPKPPPQPLLSPRELEVLGWVAKGKSDAEIASILGLSERTARFHVANAKAKLDTPSRIQAVTKAIELGLVAA